MSKTTRPFGIKAPAGIVTMPLATPLAPSLAMAWINYCQAHPTASMTSMTWLLPDRAACQEVQNQIIKLSPPDLQLPLPNLQTPHDHAPLAWVRLNVTGVLDLKPVIPAMVRTALLAKLIAQFRAKHENDSISYHRLFSYAKECESLLDEILLYRVTIAELEQVLTTTVSEHWRINIDFFRSVIYRYWPDILAEHGYCEAIEYEWNLIQQIKLAWQLKPPDEAILIAGATGARPTTAVLMDVIRKLPNGLVILPGLESDNTLLDTTQDTFHDTRKGFTPAAATEGITPNPPAFAPEHPQFAMQQWLQETAGIASSKIPTWELTGLHAGLTMTLPQIKERIRLMQHSLYAPRPVGDTKVSVNKISPLRLLTCANEIEEAEAIALLLMQPHLLAAANNADQPETLRTCLVANDERLIRLVSAQIKSFGLTCLNQSGERLLYLPLGRWLMLVARLLTGDFSGAGVIEFMRHQCSKKIIDDNELFVYDCCWRRQSRKITPRSLLHQLKRQSLLPAGNRHHVAAATVEIAAKVSEFLLPLEKLAKDTTKDVTTGKRSSSAAAGSRIFLHDFLAALNRAIEDFSVASSSAASGVDDDLADQVAAWQDFVSATVAARGIIPELAASDLMRFMRVLLAEISVAGNGSARIQIFNNRAARLVTADRIVVAGFNEDDWPGTLTPNPWISRAMRKQLRIQAAEVRQGLVCHDLLRLCSNQEIYFTRSLTSRQRPTQPSRWLSAWSDLLAATKNSNRLDEKPLITNNTDISDSQAGCNDSANRNPNSTDQTADTIDLTLVRTLSGYERFTPNPRKPAIVTPPQQIKPKSISVSGLKKLLLSPYQFYLEYCLNLRPLNDYQLTFDNRQVGTILHSAMFSLLQRYQSNPGKIFQLPRQHLQTELIELLHQQLDRQLDENSLEVFALWRPKFAEAAGYIVEQIYTSADELIPEKMLLEHSYDNKMQFKAADGATVELTLKAIFDRIDLGKPFHRLLDYKTASIPLRNEIISGKDPQLGVEAFLLQANQGQPLDKLLNQIEVWSLTNLQQAGIVKISPSEDKNSDLDLELYVTRLQSLLRYFFANQDAAFFNQRQLVGNHSDVTAERRIQIALTRQFEWGIDAMTEN